MKTFIIDGIEYQLTPVATEAPKPVKWEPNRVDVGNSYYAMDRLHDIFNSVEDGDNVDAHYSDRGNYFHSQQEGRDAAKQVRQLLRLRAYVREFAPGWEPNWESSTEQKAYVIYDFVEKLWCLKHSYRWNSPIIVYMPSNVAQDLVKKLNSGEVVL